MNPECKTAFNKANELIEKRKSKLGEHILPEIQDLDSGILLQYFENWINYTGTYNEIDTYKLKKKNVEIINDDTLKEVYMSYGEKDDLIGYVPDADKIFIMLDGEAEIHNTETGEITNLKPFSVKIFKEGVALNMYGKSDFSYFLIVKLNSPLL